MKHSSAKRGLLLAAFAIVACVSAQARAIIPFGKTDQQPWTAQFFYATIASGETRTRNEINGFHDLAIFKQGVTL